VKALKTGVGRNAASTLGARTRSSLVVAEITIAVVLLAAAGLLLRSYAAVINVDPGFEPQNLLIAQTVLSPTSYSDAAKRSAFYDGVLERVESSPGVVSAAYANFPPLVFRGGRGPITIEGRPPWELRDVVRYLVNDRSVSANYFETLGVPLLRGRAFDDRDVLGAEPSVVINESLARAHWPDADPIGTRFKLGVPGAETPWFTVIGIVGDVRQAGLDAPPEPEAYFPPAQRGAQVAFLWPQYLLVRTQGDPLALAGTVRDAVWSIDRDQPVSAIRSMEDVLEAALLNRNTQMVLLGAFAALALMLASVGLYGLLSYTVAQSTPEIGVRMALGARRRNVIASVMRSAFLLAGLGVVLGVAGSLVVGRLLTSFLFGVTPRDPLTLIAVPALLLLVALAASYVPARRAATVAPVEALRFE
jgi:putative ABC transport system permease protein